MLPWWLAGARMTSPDLELWPVVTHGAARFVSPHALSVIAGRPFMPDTWPDAFERAPHLELSEWADAFVVYPASAHYLARLAGGLADTPSLLALHATTKPVVVAPALPEGMWECPVTRRQLRLLAEQPNLTVVPPRPGISWSTGRRGAWVPPPLPHVIGLLDQSRNFAASREDQP
jgi:phosphopantothenoylcysteine decarboxylase/phosphopantothenate--cysteine ligase